MGTLSEATVEAVDCKQEEGQEPPRPKEDEDTSLQTEVQGHAVERGREEVEGEERRERGREEGEGKRGGRGRGEE